MKSTNDRRTASFLALLLAAVGVSACSRTIEEDERFERRVEPCQPWCDVVMDDECGAGNTHFEDFDACIDHCTSPSSSNWGLREDGTDACFDEQSAFFACFETISCEERTDWFDLGHQNPNHPCSPAVEPLSDCVGTERENE